MDCIYKINALVNGKSQTWTGSCTWNFGELHLKQQLPSCKLQSVECQIYYPIDQDTRIYMNGYQTWTTSPEYTVTGRIRGMHRIPKKIVNQYAFDRYGDYHFVDYPYQKGITHGESYCYFRNGDDYVLFGSLDETNGYTLFQYDANDSLLTIRRDCEGLEVSGEFSAFDLYAMAGDENKVFDGWISRLHLTNPKREKLYGYSSWYNRYQDINEDAIRMDLQGCQKLFEKGDLFQVDDGWEPFIGDWLTPDQTKFPSGMKAIADDIHSAGFQAGIWLAPFTAETNSTLFITHPDWFIQKDGQPFKCGSNWSGFYGLNIDLPEVERYIREVFDTVLNKWGYDLVKLDFLYSVATFGTNTETRAARMMRAMKLLRECCGDKLILGCGVPVFPSFGYVDYSRISCDVSLDYDDKLYMRMMHRERVSTKNAMTNIITRRQLNKRVFGSDPDVFFLRKDNIQLTDAQKKTLVTLDALLGDVFLTSDDPNTYTDEMIQQYHTYRHLTKAQIKEIHMDQNLVIRYALDGKEETVHFALPWD